MKLSELKPNPDNPRVIKDAKFKKLCESIKEFPKMFELRPIVIDENNVVLGGNMRLKALQYLGYKEIPDEWVKKADELTEEQKKEFIIKDNVPFGEWDWDILSNTFEVSELDKWGVDLPFDLMEEEDMDSKFDNSNCEYPLIPMYDEKYQAIVVICKTATEIAAIKTMFNMPMKASSYKNSTVGQTSVIIASEILK